jgi:hypothetical protein
MVADPDLLCERCERQEPFANAESTDPTPIMAIFGGTTEIQKEIIARSFGL